MSFTKFTKDPDAQLDYTIDWSSWLADSGDDSIVSSIWNVQSGIIAESDSSTETTATIWLSGGTLGKQYLVTNRITTNGGRINDRTVVIKIAQQ